MGPARDTRLKRREQERRLAMPLIETSGRAVIWQKSFELSKSALPKVTICVLQLSQPLLELRIIEASRILSAKLSLTLARDSSKLVGFMVLRLLF